MKLYTSYNPSLLKSRGFRKLVAVARGKRFSRKKNAKKSSPFISCRTAWATISPLLGPYAIKVAGASSAVSELKGSWAGRGFAGRTSSGCASLDQLQWIQPFTALTFKQSRSCYSALQTFILWQIHESCTLRPLSPSMYDEFETTIKIDPGTSMLVHPNQLINIPARSCAWSGILEN